MLQQWKACLQDTTQAHCGICAAAAALHAAAAQVAHQALVNTFNFEGPILFILRPWRTYTVQDISELTGVLSRSEHHSHSWPELW
jgi:hypothetical protein